MHSDVIEGFRLSPQQRHLWSQYAGAVPCATFALRLRGRLDVPALSGALRRLAMQHEILRTRFTELPGMSFPLQVIADAAPSEVLKLPAIEAGGLDAESCHRRALDGLGAGNEAPRAALSRLAEEDHVLSVSLPGLAADAASLDVFARALCAAYATQRVGEDIEAPAVQYLQYSEWRNEDGGDQAAAEAAAAQSVADRAATAPLRLPSEDGAGAGSGTASTLFRPDDTLDDAVSAYCHRYGQDRADFWLAVWCIALSRCGEQDRLTIDLWTDGRIFDELAEAIGPFAHTVPFPVRIAADDRFEEVLSAVSSARFALVETGPAPVTASSSPIRFEALRLSALDAGELRAQLCWADAPAPPCALKLVCLLDDTGRTTLRIVHDLARHGAHGVGLLGERLLTLAAHAAALPDTRVDRLELLGGSEREALLERFNATAREIGADTVPALIDANCRSLRGPAVIAGDEVLDYAELGRRSDRLAVHLQSLGVGRETRVAVCLRRSPQMVCALLAVMKAGAAYVPLDPDDPPQRLQYVLEDAAPALLLSDSDALHALETGDLPVLRLDEAAARIDALGDARPQGAATAEDLAYLIYTSGSTGRPKGAAITHGGLSNYLQWACRHYRVAEGTGALLHSPATFDLAVTTLFAPLLAGRPLRLLPATAGPEALAAELEAAPDWSFLKLTPAHLELLATQLSPSAAAAARVLVIGGEALHAEQVAFWRTHAPQVRLVNEYGPTETVVGCSIHEVAAEDPASGPVSIGGPIDNTRLYVLDAHLQPVPAGVSGELYVGGAGVARGYHRRPGLTAERFLPDPYAGAAGARMYRTGDTVRMRASGGLEYLGRRDAQVKVRGYRVELGEIESALRAHAGVRECAVLLRRDPPGDARLVAYVATKPGAADAGTAQLRAHLLSRLPDYMVPARFVFLDTLPVTRGGKVDRRALPAPDDARPDTGARYQAPRLFAEEVLAAIWSEVLRVDRIGIDDNFFALGGDSIRGIRIRALAQQRGLSIAPESLLQHQTIRDLAQHAGFGGGDAFVPAQPFQMLDAADRERLPDGVEDAMPLSALQAGMVFHSEYAPESAVFHDVHSIELKIPFDEAALRVALARLVQRHPMLRASFDLAGFGQPLLLVHREVPPPLDVHDLRALPREEQDARLDAWLEGEKRRTIDWNAPPLLRFAVHRRSDEICRFGFSFHHAVLDGWSVANLLTELFRTYLELHDGASPSTPPMEPVSFQDFVLLERAAIESVETAAFWDAHLRDNGALPLPREPAPDRDGVRFEQVPVPVEVSEGLKRLSGALSVPIKSVLLAAHLRVVAHWTGHDDVVTGMVTNGRPEVAGGDRIAGLFLNSLPFRQRIGAGSWADLVRGVFETERAMLPHRRFPLAYLQQRNGGQRLFDTAFNFMHYHVYQSLENLRDDVELIDWGGYEETDFPLTANFSLDLASGQVNLLLNCHRREFGDAHIAHIAETYVRVLAAMAEDRDAPVVARSLLGGSEREALLERFNATAREIGADTVPALIDANCRSLRGPAVIAGDEVLDYAELGRRSDRLAVHLQSLGVGRETRVAVCLRRSPQMVCALLAVMKAGAAYVPLDPDDPPQRLQYVLEDAAPALLLSDSDALHALETGDLPVLRLDEAAARIDALGDARPQGAATAEDLAYLIYTSGSTGRPKGAAITHGGLSNYLQWACRHYRVAEGTGALLHSPATFDLAVTTLFAPLLAGRPLRLLPATAGPEALAAELEAAPDWSFLKLTPAHLELLATQLSPSAAAAARVLVIGGEALHAEQVAFWRTHAPQVRLVNEYGPTETVVGCSIHEVAAEDPASGPVSIGGPIDNTRLYVLDAHLQPVPAGVSGELYVGGAGVARGYHRRPGLTAERFLPDPYAGAAGARMYRTGDTVRMRASGGLEYLGRRDAQVKVRGYRVELGEIESALRAHAGVRECAVLLRRDPPGDARLVAYVATKPGAADAGTAQLRAHLLSRLPDYMVPARFVFLDTLPVTRGGKVDRRALPAPDDARPDTGRAYVEPRTELERTLAGIWADVLAVDRVGVEDNFFELGGHSLPAVQIVSRIRQALSIELPLRQLFDLPTVAGLAGRVAELQRSGGGPARDPILPRRQRLAAARAIDLDALLDELEGLDDDSARRLSSAGGVPADVNPLTYDQERVWNLERDNTAGFRYTLSFMFRLQGRLDAGALERSIAELVRRHEVLRSTFDVVDGAAAQIVAHSLDVPLARFDFAEGGEAAREDRLQRHTAEASRVPFDLRRGPLVRASLYRMAEEEHVLLMLMHAIVMDGWSMGILLRELALLYRAYAAGETPPLPELPELPIQVADYAHWQRDRAADAHGEDLRDYWLARLPAQLVPLRLPERRDVEPSARGDTRTRELPEPLVRRLRDYARDVGATPFMVAMTAFQLLLRQRTGREAIDMGVGVAVRDRVETEALIGSFMNILLLHTEFAEDIDFAEAVRRVRETLLGAFAHQHVPWVALVDALREQARLPEGVPTRIMSDHLIIGEETQSVSGLTVTPVAPERQEQATGSDITFRVQERGEGMAITLFHKTDLFESAAIEAMLEDFQTLLSEGLQAPSTPIAALLARNART